MEIDAVGVMDTELFKFIEDWNRMYLDRCKIGEISSTNSRSSF